MFNQMMKWVMNNIRKPLALVVLTIALSVGGITATCVNNLAKKETASQAQDKGKIEDKKVERSGAGVVVAFLVLAATLITVGFTSSGGGWRNTLSHPTYASLIGILVGNAMVYIFAYPLWRWLADRPILFWGISMGLILFVYFVTRPEAVFKGIAYGIATLMVFGLLFEIIGNNKEKPGDNVATSKLPLVLDTIDVPTDRWSEEVKNPLIPNTKIVWERMDRSKGGNCEVLRDGDPNRQTSIAGFSHNKGVAAVYQFRCSEPGAQIKVQVIDSGN